MLTTRLSHLLVFLLFTSNALPRSDALPEEWTAAVKRARFMATASTDIEDGLYPAFGNGFIAGDAGCSNMSRDPSVKGGSCGRVHVAGVYNNETYLDYNGTYPMRAAISNPFSLTIMGEGGAVYVGAALDLSLGVVLNRSRVPCSGAASGSLANREMVEVETAIWAHRAHPNLLVWQLKALNLSSASCNGTGQISVPLASCSIGEEGTAKAFHVEDVSHSSSNATVWHLTVRAMEQPPAGSEMPPPTPTTVGVAFEPLSADAEGPVTEVTLRSDAPVVRRHAVFVSSLEDADAGATPHQQQQQQQHGGDRDEQLAPPPPPLWNAALLARERLAAAVAVPWDASDAAHARAWDELWRGGIEIEIDDGEKDNGGDGDAGALARAVNASLYALLASTRGSSLLPSSSSLLSSKEAATSLGISPGGLTHSAYCGHSFWDAETWVLPAFVALYPSLAQNLLAYRSERLEAAQDSARLQELPCAEYPAGAAAEDDESAAAAARCAVWPWESALLGYGVSPWLVADEYEIHIAGDIALAVELAFRASGNDPAFFSSESAHGSRHWEVVAASAAFFAEKAVLDEESGNFTFSNVIGPDEQAGVVNNSAYTNAVAQRTLRWAAEAWSYVSQQERSQSDRGKGEIKSSDDDSSMSAVVDDWLKIADNMLIIVAPLPTGDDGEVRRGHPEYSGYEGQDINQADVALLQYPLGLRMPSDVARNDLVYYEQRSSTGSTKGFYTGDSAYSVAWLQLGGNDTAADRQFNEGRKHIDFEQGDVGSRHGMGKKSSRRTRGSQPRMPGNAADASFDTRGFGVWKETLQDGGGNLNFLTGAGGWVQNLIFGYAKLRYSANGALTIGAMPTLPPMSLDAYGRGASNVGGSEERGTVQGMTIRGVALGPFRFSVRFDASAIQLSAPVREPKSSTERHGDATACCLVAETSNGTEFHLPVSFPLEIGRLEVRISNLPSAPPVASSLSVKNKMAMSGR